ncbi:MAG: hypothetical protein AB7D06_08835 [Pedobacter sp.]
MKKNRLAAKEWREEDQRKKKQAEDIEYATSKTYDAEKRIRGLSATIEYAGHPEIAEKVESARLLLAESYENLQAIQRLADRERSDSV